MHQALEDAAVYERFPRSAHESQLHHGKASRLHLSRFILVAPEEGSDSSAGTSVMCTGGERRLRADRSQHACCLAAQTVRASATQQQSATHVGQQNSYELLRTGADVAEARGSSVRAKKVGVCQMPATRRDL